MLLHPHDRIGSAMISVLFSTDRGFKPVWDHNKDYKIGSCCFSAKHAAALRSRSKDRLAPIQDNVRVQVEGLLFQ
jgi:hypothetical protein